MSDPRSFDLVETERGLRNASGSIEVTDDGRIKLVVNDDTLDYAGVLQIQSLLSAATIGMGVATFYGSDTILAIKKMAGVIADYELDDEAEDDR